MFLKKFWFCEVESLCIYQFQVRKWLPLAHFEETVEDDEEFLEGGGNSSAKDIFVTFATYIWTEAPAREHRFQKLRGSGV